MILIILPRVLCYLIDDTMAPQTNQCQDITEQLRSPESSKDKVDTTSHELLEEGYTRFDSPARRHRKSSRGTFDGIVYESNHGDIYTNSVNERTKRLARSLSLLGEVYSEQIEVHPVRTKAITTGLLSLMGDVLAQHLEQNFDNDDPASSWDKLRMLAMFLEGFCYSGPLLHYVFEFYEYIFPIQCVEDTTAGCNNNNNSGFDCLGDDITVNSSISHASHSSLARSVHPTPHAEYLMSQKKFVNAFLHVAFDQIIMAFPYVFGLMVITALVEGHADDLMYELKHEYYRNVVASWAAALILSPFQICAFRYLNVKWRVLWMNIQDIIWIAMMSYVTHRNRDDDGWAD